MVVTFEVSKFLKSKDFKLEQPLNISFILVFTEVSKLLRSKDSNRLQSLNSPSIVLT